MMILGTRIPELMESYELSTGVKGTDKLKQGEERQIVITVNLNIDSIRQLINNLPCPGIAAGKGRLIVEFNTESQKEKDKVLIGFGGFYYKIDKK